MYDETDSRILAVLERALHSSSRATRLRAVAMLAHVGCGTRGRWLQAALEDPDQAVRDTALAVTSWVMVPETPAWPEREDPALDGAADPQWESDAQAEAAACLAWQWEYAVEVWRGDGLLVGVFLSTSCAEDDEHAKRIALGQAILASCAAGGDQFDPAQAASFIVGKRQVRRGMRERG
jgi:hypothetical protein